MATNVECRTLTNRVDKLHPNLPNIIGDVYKTEVGHPLGAFYGYVMEGIYQNQAEIDSHLFGTVNPPDQPGDIRFKDLNGDGKNQRQRPDVHRQFNSQAHVRVDLLRRLSSSQCDGVLSGVGGVDNTTMPNK